MLNNRLNYEHLHGETVLVLQNQSISVQNAPCGVEPAFREPESHVRSTTLTAQITFNSTVLILKTQVYLIEVISLALQQGLHQQQKQVQRLAMTQTLQQSIQILQYNVEELQNFLNQKALENPLITVTTNHDDYMNSSRQNSSSQSVDENYMNQIPDDTRQSLFEYLLDQVHLTMRDTPLRNLVLFLRIH